MKKWIKKNLYWIFIGFAMLVAAGTFVLALSLDLANGRAGVQVQP